MAISNSLRMENSAQSLGQSQSQIRSHSSEKKRTALSSIVLGAVLVLVSAAFAISTLMVGTLASFSLMHIQTISVLVGLGAIALVVSILYRGLRGTVDEQVSGGVLGNSSRGAS